MVILRVWWVLQMMILAIQRRTRLIWFRGTTIREGGLQLERPIDVGRECNSQSIDLSL
jgi:hypothetical protein